MSNSFDEARIDELHAELQRSEPADMLHKYDALLETALKNAIGMYFIHFYLSNHWKRIFG